MALGLGNALNSVLDFAFDGGLANEEAADETPAEALGDGGKSAGTINDTRSDYTGNQVRHSHNFGRVTYLPGTANLKLLLLNPLLSQIKPVDCSCRCNKQRNWEIIRRTKAETGICRGNGMEQCLEPKKCRKRAVKWTIANTGARRMKGVEVGSGGASSLLMRLDRHGKLKRSLRKWSTEPLLILRTSENLSKAKSLSREYFP